MGNRPPVNPNYRPEDENDDAYPPRGNNYPPQGNYPPQNNLNIDDPQFGGGAPTPGDQSYPPQNTGGTYPPQGNYPPQGGGYPPPQQQGNINLDDPRFGGAPPPQQPSSGQRQSYPPQDSGYPPPQQQGNISLDDPRFGGAPPPQQPSSGQGQNYAQSGGYPPQDSGYPPQGGSYPPPQQQGNISLDDPRFGGAPPPQQGYDRGQGGRGRIDLNDDRYGGRPEPRGAAPSRGRDRITLDDPPVSSDRARRSQRHDDDPPPSRQKSSSQRRQEQRPLLTERQVEALSIGSVVILLGVSLIQAVTSSSAFLSFLFPMLAGGILMASAVYQRLVMGWRVNPLTWVFAILLVSYTITLFVAGDDSGPLLWIAYFIGTLIIMAGVVITLRVFRSPSN